MSDLSAMDGNMANGGNELPKNLVLTRGFSKVKANEDILAETRNRIESNLVSASGTKLAAPSPSVLVLNELAYFSFALPNLTRFDDDYRFRGKRCLRLRVRRAEE